MLHACRVEGPGVLLELVGAAKLRALGIEGLDWLLLRQPAVVFAALGVLAEQLPSLEVLRLECLGDGAGTGLVELEDERGGRVNVAGMVQVMRAKLAMQDRAHVAVALGDY